MGAEEIIGGVNALKEEARQDMERAKQEEHILVKDQGIKAKAKA